MRFPPPQWTGSNWPGLGRFRIGIRQGRHCCSRASQRSLSALAICNEPSRHGGREEDQQGDDHCSSGRAAPRYRRAWPAIKSIKYRAATAGADKVSEPSVLRSDEFPDDAQNHEHSDRVTTPCVQRANATLFLGAEIGHCEGCDERPMPEPHHGVPYGDVSRLCGRRNRLICRHRCSLRRSENGPVRRDLLRLLLNSRLRQTPISQDT